MMLNLNKLEQEIDNFVDTVTKEELESFIEEEKNLSYLSLLGGGYILSKELVSTQFNISDNSTKSTASDSNSISNKANFELAA